MNKEDITVSELASTLLAVGKKKHSSDYAYAFALGSLQGLFESARWGYRPIQAIVNDAYYSAKKDLEEME